MPGFTLTICGLDELDLHSAGRATHVLSILDPDWPVPDAFRRYGPHERLELRFHDIIDEAPGTGYDAPQAAHVEDLLRFGRTMAEPPGPARLLVHCHAGISRSTAAATLLLAQADPARPAADIVEEIVRIRDKAWPNLRMIEFGDRLLGRDGALVAAVRARHRHVATTRPEIERMMREVGRHRELDFR